MMLPIKICSYVKQENFQSDEYIFSIEEIRRDKFQVNAIKNNVFIIDRTDTETYDEAMMIYIEFQRFYIGKIIDGE